jgi:orotidine-5'-phosphate decarboxylase
MSFMDRFTALKKEKKTLLCVGVDPALPSQRKQSVISNDYVSSDENKTRLSFCLDIVRDISDYAVAVKPNQQYLFGFTKEDHRKLASEIRRLGMISILDYKLNDISDSVSSAIYHISDSGYDAITFNPLPGNLLETVQLAHELALKVSGRELGIIVLTLMSNPEAITFMKKGKVDGLPIFKVISKQVRDYNADGCVVGATGHVSSNEIRSIRKIIGASRLLLVPGIGAQGGDIQKILAVAGENTLVNVSRDIIYANNPRIKAKEYDELLKKK